MGHQHIPDPAGMGRDVQGIAQIELQRSTVVASVPLAIAENRTVGGDHNGLQFQRLAACHQIGDMLAGAIQVNLHPGAHPLDGGNLFDGDSGGIAQHEGNAGTSGCLGQVPIATIGQQAVETGRADQKGHARWTLEEMATQVTLADIDQRARLQGDALEHAAVAPERHLIVGTTLDILEGKIRQPTARHRPQLINALRPAIIAARIETSHKCSRLMPKARPWTRLLRCAPRQHQGCQSITG
ncbi:hypothetical protein D9M68_655040 [compost metagenome]